MQQLNTEEILKSIQILVYDKLFVGAGSFNTIISNQIESKLANQLKQIDSKLKLKN